MKELELKDRIFEGRANGIDLKEDFFCIWFNRKKTFRDVFSRWFWVFWSWNKKLWL